MTVAACRSAAPSKPPPPDPFRPLELPAPNRLRTGAGTPGPDYWQQKVDYAIDATLDPDARTVTATATVTYTNRSPDALRYLWIHLEQNIARADSLARRREPGPTTAGMEIRSLRADGRDLPLVVYDTVGRIDLPAPIAPGATFAFEIAWRFEIGAAPRHGIDPSPAAGPIFELAQWFPAVAVYDDVYGWNTLPYLGAGEFYTDFGDYDVSLTVPRDYLCFASGTLSNPEAVLTAEQRRRLESALASDKTVAIAEPGDERAGGTWRFRAERVRTFAWAASKAFVWDAAGVDVAGRRVLCQSAYPKEQQRVWAESTQMVRHSIAHYSRRLMDYPWPQMTNVNGSEYGMEYPMIVFCGQVYDRDDLFYVTDHEVGHAWFPMIVNTDERRHAWMDEGFNTFINIYSQDEYLGHRESWMTMQLTADEMKPRDAQPLETRPDLARDLGFLAYQKPGHGLQLLREQVLGPERFDAAFRRYVEAWAFKSPRPADFFRLMEDASGADLAWFWRGWFLETARVDQAVTAVGAVGPDRLRVRIENLGALPMPVTLAFEGGEPARATLPVEAWYDGPAIDRVFEVSGRVTRVVVDPNGALPDVDRSNNVWYRP